MRDLVSDGVDRFLEAEVDPEQCKPTGFTGPVRIAAIGTTAGRAVRGTLLGQAIAARGLEIDTAEALADLDVLMADSTWQLGVVLSPWKREIGGHCSALAPSAAITGVVDTVLRTRSGPVGFNTNTWAAVSALETLTGGLEPSRLLLLGSGASSRSVALAVSRHWPRCAVHVAARRPEAAAELLSSIGGVVAAEGSLARRWPLVINTTTWGETEASEAESFGVDLDGVFVPGGRLFDLNNRISTLQHQALEAGCAVVSGAVMQRVTNASRAALLAYSTP